MALEKMQDKCIQRYPCLYGLDDRIRACMAELGVPLTKEKGFHQVSFFFFLINMHEIKNLIFVCSTKLLLK